MTVIVFSSLPDVIVRSLADEASDRRLTVLALEEVDVTTPFVHAVGMIGSSNNWDLVASERWANRIGCVVVTDRYQAQFYRRTYEQGAAGAHLDSPVKAIIDVVVARARGEILAPAALLRSVLAPQATLLTGEVAVLRGIARGLTVAQIAEQTFFSDRHVRRLLQSIMTKAETNDREAAVEHFVSSMD